jgi:hypothetical protein
MCIVLLIILAVIFLVGLSNSNQSRSAAAGSSLNGHTGNRTIYYRTNDGRADYGFSLERQTDGSLRPYITSMPSYGSRDTGLHTTHRLSEGNRYYVCWSRSLHSEQEVKDVVSLWADLTQTYIRTGTSIDEQMRRR